MKKTLTSLAFAAASTLMASHASAGLTTWTETFVVDQYVGVALSSNSSVSYEHNLTTGSTPAFLPKGMTALSGTISIEVYDDLPNCPSGWAGIFCQGAEALQEGLSPEIVLFQIEDFDFDTGNIQLGLNTFAASLGVNALASINQDGKLSVTITSLGDDFIVGNSILTVQGVPEPETLGLMGFSLLGLAFLRRRQQAKA